MTGGAIGAGLRDDRPTMAITAYGERERKTSPKTR
jgi:hypothetical protein